MTTQPEKFSRNLEAETLPWLVVQTPGHAVLSSHTHLCYHNLAGTLARPNYTTVPSVPTAALTGAVVQQIFLAQPCSVATLPGFTLSQKHSAMLVLRCGAYLQMRFLSNFFVKPTLELQCLAKDWGTGVPPCSAIAGGESLQTVY